MDFEQLVQKLEKFTFEEIVQKYNQLYGTKFLVECNGNKVYEDDDLYEFMYSIGAEIEYFMVGYAVISTNNGKYYEIPYECRENRFNKE